MAGHPVATPLRVRQAPAAQQLLALDAISKSWGPRAVLKSVSLELPEGALLHVHGRNGAGKTTLLRIIAGIFRPDEGQVTLRGELTPERHRREYQQSIGFLAAGDRGIYARLTGRRNLEFWAAVAFIERSRRAAAIERVVEMFLPDGLADQRTDRMSTGQRQRVRLAMAFMHRPQLVLLDEPTASLDDVGVASLIAALEEHKREGGSMICCSPGADRDALPFDDGFLLQDGHLVPE